MRSRQSIRILIGLMSVALIGVIVIQFLWIRNAMLLKQEQFDRTVNAAMIRVSADLENKYGVHFITEKLETDSSARKEVMKQDPGFYKFMISVNDPKEVSADDMDNDKGESVFTIASNNNDCNNGESYSSNAQNIEVRTGNGKRKVVAMVNVNNNGKQQVVIERSVLRDPPTPPSPPTSSKSLKLINIVKDVADEYAMSKMSVKDISEIIDSPQILSAIQKEFAKQGLPQDFVFATYCVDGDSLMINKNSSLQPLKDYSYKSPLLATDFIEAGSLLLINFPKHYRYLFSAVAGMLALSLFFTITIISAFAYSLHVIFAQKKISEITNDFINNMTHELKTPLATISMTADTLGLSSVNNGSDLVNEYTGMIKHEVQKLSRHVDRILDAAALERTSKANHTELINLHELLYDEVRAFEPLVQQKGGRIETSFPLENIPIPANKDLLHAAICNLLDNAVKYSKDIPEIKITACRNANNILISVSDNGIGIQKTDQKLIFEKFYRAHTGNRHDVKGFGLGLSFVKSVLGSLHGKVWVESEVGKGSTFFMEFPVA